MSKLTRARKLFRLPMPSAGALALASLLLGGCAAAVVVEKIGPDQQHSEGLSYFLAKGIVDLTIKRAADTGITLAVGAPQYIPDPKYHYSVRIDHNPLYDDDITVSVDDKGLLKSVNSVTHDRSPEIIKKIAQAPIEIFGVQENAPPPQPRFDIKYTLDPTSPDEVSKVAARLRRLDPSVQFRARPLIELPSDYSPVHPDCGVHICFRTAIPYALELYTEKKATKEDASVTVIARQIVVLPNKHVVAQIPITRAPFVKKEFILAFSSGMLTSVQLKNPSEVLEFIQIPIAVAKAIVAIPSAMMQFKTTQITADNNLLAQQQKNLDLQTQIIDAQQKLLQAQKEKSP